MRQLRHFDVRSLAGGPQTRRLKLTVFSRAAATRHIPVFKQIGRPGTAIASPMPDDRYLALLLMALRYPFDISAPDGGQPGLDHSADGRFIF
jgi:hypothetical protein